MHAANVAVSENSETLSESRARVDAAAADLAGLDEFVELFDAFIAVSYSLAFLIFFWMNFRLSSFFIISVINV